MPDLGLLRSFLAVYRAGTVTEAARALHMSQPAVTAHIQSLERQLGTELFVRQPRRGVQPTAAAQTLALRIAPHLDALATSTLLTLATGTTPLRLGGPKDLLATYVIPALSPLIAEGLRIEARTDDQPTVMDDVAGGELDLAVTVGAVIRRGLRIVTLFDKQVALVGTPRWAQRVTSEDITRRGADALADVPLLAYSPQLPVISIYFKALFGTLPAFEPALVIDDLRTLTEAVRHGAGVTVLPWYYIAPDLADGTLVELHQPRRRPTEPVIAAMHPTTATPWLAVALDALRANVPVQHEPAESVRTGQ